MDDLFSDEAGPRQTVLLNDPVDLVGFRQHARRLLASHARPEDVSWHCAGEAEPDLFAEPAELTASAGLAKAAAPVDSATSLEPASPARAAAHPESARAADLGEALHSVDAIQVPAGFLTLCESVILHSDPRRFGLLYRLLWRLVHEPALRHDPLDADRIEAQHMAQAVRRDMHKMKAFVRFRTVQDEIFRSHPEGGLLHVAWFEPEHHIVRAVAPFFARRFTQMRWAILTPECCVEWDCISPLPLKSDARTGSTATGASTAPAHVGQLHFGPGASKSEAPPADAGEQLWLTYYQHIFNPARLKLKMMQKEMPRKYWQNLPEAQFISALAASAPQRQMDMVQSAPSQPVRRIPVFQVSAAGSARQAALGMPDAEPASLTGLAAALQRCRECSIGLHATQAVSGEGPANARLMVVGEQPGDQEDLQGRPFVGPAGQLFDRALAELGADRNDLFITNAVKHFKYEPRGKRRLHKTPSQQEAAACGPWLESEVALVKPQAALALGATAAAALLGRPVAVTRERGQWLVRPDGLRVMVTLHPAALLRMDPALRDTAYVAWLQDIRLGLDVAQPEA